jgi:RIO kinase 1
METGKMNTNDSINFFDELDDDEQTDNFISKDKRRQRFPERHFKTVRAENAEFIGAQDDSRRSFKFTYQAARFEEWWLLDSLGDFYVHQWITDVIRRVKGGKEASVYQCRPGAAIDVPSVAAKVYRPRSLRNLKNDHQYRAGRADLDESGNVIVDDGTLHAMEKRTTFGEEVRHQSWIAYEYRTLEILYEAGADVPRPYAMEKNAILMGFVGDLSSAAPALHSVKLDPDEAASLYERVIRNIDIMLSHDRIHGDLSAYNILYWDGDITLIDFPQVVLPESNPASWTIFRRDVERICQYFSAQGVACDPNKIAPELWAAHGHRVIKQVDPKYLDAEKPQDRQVWEKQK